MIFTIIKCLYLAIAFVTFVIFGMWMLRKWVSDKNLTPLWAQGMIVVVVAFILSLLWFIVVPFLWHNRKKS
jgi:hypothetical protein